MFTRSPVGEPTPLEPLKNANASPSKPPQPRSGSTEPGKSVISNDLKIIGQDLKIISQGTLQVDGEIEGDVRRRRDHHRRAGEGDRHRRRRAGDRPRQDLRGHPRNDRGATSFGPRRR